MLGWFDERGVKELLDIPFDKRIGLLITVGYPPTDYPTRKKIRKSFNEVVSFNSYKG
jgi:nitroreductase